MKIIHKGFCLNCGKEFEPRVYPKYPRSNKKFCSALCRENYGKRMAKIRKRIEGKKLGICQRCFKNPVKQGTSMCNTCLDYFSFRSAFKKEYKEKKNGSYK